LFEKELQFTWTVDKAENQRSPALVRATERIGDY